MPQLRKDVHVSLLDLLFWFSSHCSQVPLCVCWAWLDFGPSSLLRWAKASFSCSSLPSSLPGMPHHSQGTPIPHIITLSSLLRVEWTTSRVVSLPSYDIWKKGKIFLMNSIVTGETDHFDKVVSISLGKWPYTAHWASVFILYFVPLTLRVMMYLTFQTNL